MTTQDPTTNYAWNLPTDGGDAGSWGTLLNAIIGDDVTGIDAIVKAVSNVANAALPKAGGTMTGELVTLTQTFTYVNVGNITTTAALDLDAGNFFYATVTGNVAISLSNVPSGVAVFGILEITNGGAFTTTFAAAWKWPGGTAPTLTTSGVDVISFYTRDGGTTVRAALINSDNN